MPHPITDAERRKVRRLHTAGRNRNQIAAALGRSGSTVSKIASQLGLTFDRAKVRAATEAKQADAKQRRASIVHRLYTLTERTLDRLERAEHERSEANMGEVVRWAVTELPAGDVRNLTQTIATATAQAVKLEQLDATDGTDTVGSLLGALFDQLKDRHPDGG